MKLVKLLMDCARNKIALTAVKRAKYYSEILERTDPKDYKTWEKYCDLTFRWLKVSLFWVQKDDVEWDKFKESWNVEI